MSPLEMAQYLIFLLFIPLSIFSIFKGHFYIAVFSAAIALIDLAFLGLKIFGVA